MATKAQINANCLNMQFFMSSVNLPALRLVRRSASEVGSSQGEAGCQSMSKQHNRPILPRLPNPPEQKNNRTHLRDKNPELLMAKQLTKIYPRQFSRFGVQFSPIREHKRCFQAISRAIRDNWRYFETNVQIQNPNPRHQSSRPHFSCRQGTELFG